MTYARQQFARVAHSNKILWHSRATISLAEVTCVITFHCRKCRLIQLGFLCNLCSTLPLSGCSHIIWLQRNSLHNQTLEIILFVNQFFYSFWVRPYQYKTFYGMYFFTNQLICAFFSFSEEASTLFCYFLWWDTFLFWCIIQSNLC